MKNIQQLLISIVLIAANAPVMSELVDYRVGEELFEGYVARASADAPLVIILHDWDGLNAYEIKRAEMLKGEGYNVFAVDLFGKGLRPAEIEERKRMTGALYADRQRMRSLLEGSLTAARANGLNTEQAVAMGYCFGGSVALELARSGTGMKGFVSFHGGLETPEGQDYSQVQAPILVFHGSADVIITMDAFAALGKALEQAGVKHEMTTYSGAPHAFTMFDSERYRPQADQKSWARFLEFLEESL